MGDGSDGDVDNDGGGGGGGCTTLVDLVELGGYVIILVETRGGKIKLYGAFTTPATS